MALDSQTARDNFKSIALRAIWEKRYLVFLGLAMTAESEKKETY